MSGLSSTFLKSLGITPEGKCAKHPQITLICEEHSALFQECDLCWKEQQDRKDQETNGGDNDTVNTETLDIPPPCGLDTIPSGKIFEDDGVKDAVWIDAVQSRWKQVQENGVLAMVENEDALNKENCIHKQTEVEPEELARSRTNLQLKRLEEHMKKQDAIILKLQKTVEQQELNIRQDIQHLIQAVSLLTKEKHQPGQGPEIYSPNHDSGVTQQVTNGVETVGRPSMYSKSHHPANIFTSARTIERTPPKPPMRHCSFSTQTPSVSLQSATVSSLGASTRLTKSSEAENSIPQHKDIEIDLNCKTPSNHPYKPGFESMLERDRHKQLEIIFDASGICSMGDLKSTSNEQGADNEGGMPNRRHPSHKSLHLNGDVELSQANETSPSLRFQKRSNSPPSNASQPHRAPSERDINASHKGSAGETGRYQQTGSSPNSTKTKSAVYVPPPPPPLPSQSPVPANNQMYRRKDPISNLSQLAPGTAPPRREIFTTLQSSKMQLSCLTIDSALSGPDQSVQVPNDGTVYREVSDLVLTDKFGDRGYYSGTLREEDDGNGEKDYKPEGYGEMVYDNGAFYKGNWKAGHWHGHGSLCNTNKDTYEGDFVYDSRHGRGIYRYANGDEYEGDFTEDQRHGKGFFRFASGATYVGDFKCGDFEGYGTFTFEDGHYEGSWLHGAYHGIGTLQFNNGKNYTGRFKNGVADGSGEEKSVDGKTTRGVWSEGVLIERISS